MVAQTEDLTIEQGAVWSHGWAVTYKGTPIDDTWTAKSQIRDNHQPGSKLLHEFTTYITPAGAVVISVSHEESSPWRWTEGVYDVEITNADESVCLRVAQGTVTVSMEVTR